MSSFYSGLLEAFAPVRLKAFHNAEFGPINVHVVGRYVHNIVVCQQLTPALHIFEVTLRNQMHRAFTNTLGNSAWYDIAGFLKPTQIKQRDGAKNKLIEEGKPITPDRMVAELTLGFWISFYSTAYQQMWLNHPSLLQAVFPRMPRHARKLSDVSKVINPLRTLRNRVSHWERVAHLPDLLQRKQDIDRVVRWLNPSAELLLKRFDGFATCLGSSAQTSAQVTAFQCIGFDGVGRL